MKISVVIPVYNAEKYLHFSLGSVLGQTHTDWECICVDDGSTDRSGAILDEYAAKDSRFHVIHKANGGVSSARNMALQAATGELIAFLDADDVWHPMALSISEKTRAETQADVIRFHFKFVTSHNEPFETLSPDTCGKNINLQARTQSIIRICQAGSATIISRNTCGDVRFLPLPQGEDVIFVLDCMLHSRRVAFIDKPLLHYLMHPAQNSRKISESLIVGTCNYIPEFASRCAKIGGSDAAKADTFRYLCDILFLRVFKSWHLFDDRSASSNIKEAFWHAVSRLAQQQNFFPPLLQKFVLTALNKKSSCLLKTTVIWPYRLSKKINLRWITS